MKKIFTMLLCALALTATAMADTALHPADTDGDGRVTIADAQLIYDYILGTADAKVTLEQVDVNNDGVVNTLDVVAVYVAMKDFVDVASVTLSHSEVSMERGESLQLTATINPSNATFQALTWKSSATSVVAVDANGEITANGVGTATITVAAANGVKATCVVKVGSITGIAPDSNDSEFGAPAKAARRGEWGNLWN